MRLFALDTETGGFKAAENALLSMSIVELGEDLMPVRHLDLFILPEPDRTVNEDAAKINGYTPELWTQKGAKPLKDAYLEAQAWLGQPGGIALAHNAPFDRGFVLHNQERTGVNLGFADAWECSLMLFRASCSKLRIVPKNHKLDSLAALCGHWGPEYVRGAHGAHEDAMACAAGYRWLKQQLAARMPAKAAV